MWIFDGRKCGLSQCRHENNRGRVTVCHSETVPPRLLSLLRQNRNKLWKGCDCRACPCVFLTSGLYLTREGDLGKSSESQVRRVWSWGGDLEPPVPSAWLGIVPSSISAAFKSLLNLCRPCPWCLRSFLYWPIFWVSNRLSTLM